MKKVLVLLALFLFLFTSAFVGIFCIDEYVKPDIEPLSPEQQEIADRYYELVFREYPSFKAIRREMLRDIAYQWNNRLELYASQASILPPENPGRELANFSKHKSTDINYY